MAAPQWRGIVKKSRALLDGSNLYQRIVVRLDDDQTVTTRVHRRTWKTLAVDDAVERTADGKVQRAVQKA